VPSRLSKVDESFYHGKACKLNLIANYKISSLQNTVEQWQYVFYILACTYTVGALCFVIFGSGELQEWNSPKTVDDVKPEEQPLNEEKA
jgi:hypothetical protein